MNRARTSSAGLVGALVLVACSVGCGRSTVEPTPAPSALPDPSDYASTLVEVTNDARVAEGLDPLVESDCAILVAADRAAALVGRADLVHAPLDDAMTQCSVSTAGENLSRAVAPPEDVLAAWMDSPGHRANILDPAYIQVGVACVADGDATLCSQVFLGE